jgi:hypothetical protein
MNTTTQENKQNILADLWMNYRDDENFDDFISYNDLGLPLAYILSANIVKSTEMADKFVNETFDLLLASLEVEDTGFDNLDDIFIASGY